MSNYRLRKLQVHAQTNLHAEQHRRHAVFHIAPAIEHGMCCARAPPVVFITRKSACFSTAVMIRCDRASARPNKQVQQPRDSFVPHFDATLVRSVTSYNHIAATGKLMRRSRNTSPQCRPQRGFEGKHGGILQRAAFGYFCVWRRLVTGL